MMKAYGISDRNGDAGIELVIFAESRGKALAYAVNTDELCDYGYTGLRAKRIRQLDKYYRGLPEMNWLNDDDRIAMVKEADFQCGPEFGCVDGQDCPAYKWCSLGKGAEKQEDEDDEK